MNILKFRKTNFNQLVEAKIRWSVVVLLLFLILASIGSIAQGKQAALKASRNQKETETKLVQFHQSNADWALVRSMEVHERELGLNIDMTKATDVSIGKAITDGDYAKADTLIKAEREILTRVLAVQQAKDFALESSIGTLGGTVTGPDGVLPAVTISLTSTSKLPNILTTDVAGNYRFAVLAGDYSLKATAVGYVESTSKTITVTALNLLTINLALEKLPVLPPPPVQQPVYQPSAQPTYLPPVAPQASNSTAYSSYSHTTLNGHTADIMTFNLSSGHIRVMMDTANDTDCADSCNVQSVGSFVQQDHGFAGINGSYFCPTAYGASCAGKTNSFYWKEYNSRVQRMINPTNTLGEQDPFMVFTSSGHVTLLPHWVDYPSAGPIYAGFSCTPLLLYNGQNIVNTGTLDNKQLTAYISRGAIALKGQTLYVVTVQGATVPDLAQALVTLGVDSAINSDAGGSSGMYYNGSYRLGPGRAVPNALVFVEQ